LIIFLFILLGFNVQSVLEGLGILAVVATGPALMIAYMAFLSKSNSTDFTAFDPRYRVATVGVITGMILSTGAIVLYLLNNPELITL
jgi:hypothetical protein